jgi:transcriptional regulator with XRE-family HTH domain
MLAPITNSLGQRLKYYRTQRGLTQQQLADVCDITDAAIRNYERDARVPDRDTLIVISEELDVSYYALTGKYDPAELFGYVHFIMESSNLYETHPEKIDGKFALIFDVQPERDDVDIDADDYEGPTFPQSISAAMRSWCAVYEDYKAGNMTIEEYETWIARYPHSLHDDYDDENSVNDE